MGHTPRYLMTDPERVEQLVRDHPWATFVSATSTGLVASHSRCCSTRPLGHQRSEPLRPTRRTT